MSITIDGGAGITFPDTVQQTNGVTNTGGAPPYYAARAWVNFNGTGTVAIRASSNISSVTDGGTGTYTASFTTPMPDANYVVVGASALNSGASTKGLVSPVSLSAGSISLRTSDESAGYVTSTTNADHPIVCIAIFR